jgi:tetratricopeptide (TPR) repeat protein
MIAHSWLGHLSGSPRYINLGNKGAALEHYRKGMAIAESLAASDAKNVLFRSDLPGAYQNIAEALSEDDPEQSVSFYRKALAVTGSLLEAEPNDVRHLRRLALCLRGMAAPLERMGDLQGARRNLRQALDTLRQLATKDPAYVNTQIDLHTTCYAIGDLALRVGELSGAEEHYRQALAFAESAMASNSTVYAMWRLADAYSGLGQYHAALAADKRASNEERLARWRESREWREKSLKVWDSWPERGVSSVFNQTRRERAARALAECDAALAKLTAAPNR